jgi:hypothetical protein
MACSDGTGRVDAIASEREPHGEIFEQEVTSVRVLIDGAAMQAKVHQRDNVRLRDLIVLIERARGRVEVTSSGEDLSIDVLQRCDVVVIPTRSPVFSSGYTAGELNTVESFVERGGGLLLMSNHGSTDRIPDHTAHDRELAARFGVTIEATVFCKGSPVALAAPVLQMNPDDLAVALAATASLEDIARDRGVDPDDVFDALVVTIERPWLTEHPVIANDSASIRGVCFNNCASLRAPSSVSLVRLPEDLVDIGQNLPPNGKAFAIAVDGATGEFAGAGRVIITGDSGFIGSRGSSFPGPGLLDRADNAAFIRNALEWLSEPAQTA